MALTKPSTTSTATKGVNTTYQQQPRFPRRSGFSVASCDDGYQFARSIELANTPSRKSSPHRRFLVASQQLIYDHQQLLGEQCLLLLPRVAFPFAPFTNGTMKKSTLDNISVFLAELIGTGLLVMLGCMGCVSGLGHTPSHFELCINFGLIVMIIVQVFGCVSGSHLNPAVTAAAWVYELVSTKMALAYGAAQCIGAFMGYGILKLLTPAAVFNDALEKGAGFCVTQPNSAITSMQALGIEFVATMVLVLVCCGVWDPRNAKHHDSVALKFGFTVGALAVAAGPYTGASMNPARSLGPVLWNGVYNAHWIYWVGPLGAAFLTAFAYKAVFRREAPVEQLNHELAALNTDKSNA